MKRSNVSAVMGVALLCAPAVFAQTAPKPKPTYEQAIFNAWKEVHDKILVMAKDAVYPDTKLGWKPHPDSRSVIDEFRHVTIGLEMTTAQAKGQKYDFEAKEKEYAKRPQTRAAVIAEMEAAIAESYVWVKSNPSPSLVGWLEHQGEHYGKLVDAYRVNGVVPPISRQKS